MAQSKTIKNSWSLIAFAREFGPKMQVGEFVNSESGETFKSCIFTMVLLAPLLLSAASLVFSLQDRLQHRRMTFRWFSVRQKMVKTCIHFAIRVRTLGRMLTLNSNNNERQEKSCFSFLPQQQ